MADPTPTPSFTGQPEGSQPVTIVAVGGPMLYVAEIGVASVCLIVAMLAALVVIGFRR